MGGDAPAARQRAPRDYTPRHLAEKILTQRSALEGERKQVTVLFADVEGSLELAEALDPEEWHAILDRFFQILTEGVHRFEGTVNQYTGDGIMALFGAPIAHEDHAQRACYAALRLREALRDYAQELRRERGFDFLTRIGLNSGEVVVAKIGDDLRMDYTAQGHTVGLAERTQQLAEPGKPYLSEATAALVRGYFRLEDLGEFRIKGAASPLRVYGLEGAGELRTRLDVSRARGFSRFVGRADELDTLEGALQRTREGDGRVVGVVGQPGVGKSRLCLQFAEQCRVRGMRVLEAHFPSHGKTVPLLPVLEFVRDAFGITPLDTDQAAREKIAGRLVLLDRSLEEGLPLLFDFAGVADPADPAPRMDPEARQQQLYRLLRHWVQATSEREPAVFLFDDVQWIDEASDIFLAGLVQATRGTRILLLANFRPEYRAAWMDGPRYRPLPLAPLGPEVSRELLDELLGGDASLAGLPELVRERTGGNPFFIEEVVQSLAESRSLSGARGGYRLVTPVAELAIPATVQAVLAARIDRLPEREKQLLQRAAVATVVDKRCSESLLARIADLPGADLAAALARLAADELLVEEALYPEREYVFKHPLTQSVAYDAQLSDRRARIHAALARALAELHADKPDEHAAPIAHHWEEAGEAVEAARWHRRAALGWGPNAATERRRHWESVVGLLAGVPEPHSPEVIALALLARVRLVAHEWYGAGLSSEELHRLFEEGCRLAERAGDARSSTLLHLNYVIVRCHQGEVVDRIEPLVQRAAQLAEELGDADLRILVLLDLQFLARVRGDLSTALEAGGAIRREFEPDVTLGRDELGGLSPYLGTHVWSAIDLARSGRIDAGVALLEGVAERAVGDRAFGSWQAWCRAWLERLRGSGPAALGAAQEALRISLDAGSAMTRILSLTEIGHAHGLLGSWRDSQRALEEALRLARERQLQRMTEAEMLAGLSRAQLETGDVASAARSAQAALAIAEERGYRGDEAEAQLARARVLRQRDGLAARAEHAACLERAGELIGATGIRALAPEVEIERAELARLAGDDAARERLFREVRRLYTEMGATGHAERLARELGP